MDQSTIKDTLDAYQRNELSPEQVQVFLQELENINDPERINDLLRIFNNFAMENNININEILPVNMQHNIEGLEGNTGTLPANEPKTFQNVLFYKNS